MVLFQPFLYMAFQAAADRGAIPFIPAAGALIAKSIFLLKVYQDMSGLIMVRQHVHHASHGLFHGPGFYHGIDAAYHLIGHLCPGIRYAC